MLGFIIPFRPKSSSNDWVYHSALLKRTVKSILNQVDKNFLIVVVYSDMPVEPETNANLHYVRFPYPVYTKDDLEKESVNNVNAMDQGRRTLFGCRFCRDAGCKYLMSVDADDLIAKGLAGYVNSQLVSGKPGWYVDKGYVYIEGSSFVYRFRKNMNYFNGSTHIVRADLVPDPDFSSKNLMDFNFFAAHGWLKERIVELYQEQIDPLPFYAIVYSMNNVSWTNQAMLFQKKGFLKIIKLMLQGQLVTKPLKNNFNLYAVIGKGG